MADLPFRLGGLGLELRLPVIADIEAIVAACQDAEIARWTSVPRPYTAEHATAWIQLAGAQHAAGTDLGLLVCDGVDRSLLGATGAKDISWETGETEVGYWVAAAARRRGVASRALQVLSAWLLGAGMRRLTAKVVVGNDASERVLAGVGYQREGVLRSIAAGGCGIDVERLDVSLWSLLPTDPGGRDLLDLDVESALVPKH